MKNMPKNEVLLEDSFTKVKHPLVTREASGECADQLVTMYCCGPTVYEDSHLGHAITYLRCDLMRKALHYYHNIHVVMAMNITDIDDKIIAKAIETNTDFRKVSNIYLKSFMDDMKALNIWDADCYLRVSDHLKTIMDYINTIRDKGLAYISPNNDINFDFEHFVKTLNISDTIGTDGTLVSDKSVGKKSPKDFTLWKAAKPGEPKWDLLTTDGMSIAGRPGWHIECSALCHKVFGHRLDVHFGGIDLRFPHHHCESCCSHAFHQTVPSKPLYEWVRIWLHSGHLNLMSDKMSKSLGNVILIKDFLKNHSPNILRLSCITSHYRSHLVYEDNLLHEMKSIDKRLLDFKEERLISEGIADDLDLEMGLNAILLLAKRFNSMNNFTLLELIRTKQVLNKWLDSMGLKYSKSYGDNDGQSVTELVVIKSFSKFRTDVRNIALNSIKSSKKLSSNPELASNEMQKSGQQLLSLCDGLRQQLDVKKKKDCNYREKERDRDRDRESTPETTCAQ
ncbi:unnamed protein product [Oppiella nova]|uniref:tRNA synthetases class I catalytic domain-containing protein n=1 Tax=Oppiella nova TaxID=334625 RepID=A0A7R9LSS0_9ACAR|nr:unnamed protein product [Oppiella nova]CAG2166596.1 unnamed protein product [Oppiella nova]